MSLIDDAIADAAEFTANESDFGVAIELTSPTEETASISGYSTKHHLKIDANSGQVINSQNASVVVSEANILVANADYPVRISDSSSSFYREVNMIGHRVTVTDSSGVAKNFSVTENFADETLGLITLMLENYSAE